MTSYNYCIIALLRVTCPHIFYIYSCQLSTYIDAFKVYALLFPEQWCKCTKVKLANADKQTLHPRLDFVDIHYRFAR